MDKQKLTQIIQSYLGAEPADKGCVNWNHMQTKMLCEIEQLAATEPVANLGAPTTVSPDTSLLVVRQHLRHNFSKGCQCPACGQYVKLYTRKLTSAMAYGLILLVKSGKTDFFHVEKFLKELDCPSSLRGDISKLCHFGLLETLKLNRQDGSNRAGYFRVTDKARAFVNETDTVPQSVQIYNNHVQGVAKQQITIKQALGQKFSYNELMGR